EVLAEARAVAGEARDAAVRVGASLDALVAARAALEVDQQGVLRVVEIELDEPFDELGRDARRRGLELAADAEQRVGEAPVRRPEGTERLERNADDLEGVETRRGREAGDGVAEHRLIRAPARDLEGIVDDLDAIAGGDARLLDLLAVDVGVVRAVEIGHGHLAVPLLETAVASADREVVLGQADLARGAPSDRQGPLDQD